MRVSFICALPLLAFCVLSAGCDNQQPRSGEMVEREGEPAITYVESDDPKMLAAIDRARETFTEFKTAFEKAGPNQSYFSVKLLIKEGEHQEHVWTTPVRFEGDEYYGTLDNEPYEIKKYVVGDEIHSPVNEISDWMYVADGKLVGGNTLRVVRDSLTKEQQEAFDLNLPFKIE
ncbi:YegJ family protein [Gimesia panareensis]|uniref:YegJ family protein n=1 Tax=Gimesia panareensis TaxID=2527978 RepID=UPI00118A5DBB|nr:DUF2314 domain-containing protein [Gimesia panareensis]QDU51689.1 hypothetical protein Pan110_40560 [Gimesia panareensis]